MPNLETWLRKQLDEAEAAEHAARAALEESRDRVSELRVTLKWLSRAPGATIERESDEDFSGLTQADAAAVVLRDAGKPLTLNAIIDGILDRGFEYGKDLRVLNRSLRGSLSRMVTEEDVFFRVRRGVYGLLEWKESGENASAPNSVVSEPGAEQRPTSTEGGEPNTPSVAE